MEKKNNKNQLASYQVLSYILLEAVIGQLKIKFEEHVVYALKLNSRWRRKDSVIIVLIVLSLFLRICCRYRWGSR